MRIAAAAGAVVLAATVVGAAASPASATPPVRDYLQPVSFEAVGVCDFPILYEETVNNGRLTYFADGRASGIGSYKVRITNESNPSKSMDINATGPIWFYPDGTIRLHGRQLFVMTGGIDYTSGIYLATGNLSYTRNAVGGIAAITGTGSLGSNLCSRIA